MKAWIIALAFVTSLGMAGLASAADTGTTKAAHKHHGGMHGKVTAVGANSFTITTGGKKNPHTMTVNFTAATTVEIEGAAGGKIDASLVGKHVSLVGAMSTTGGVEAYNATAVKVGGHHHKKAPAA